MSGGLLNRSTTFSLFIPFLLRAVPVSPQFLPIFPVAIGKTSLRLAILSFRFADRRMVLLRFLSPRVFLHFKMNIGAHDGFPLRDDGFFIPLSGFRLTTRVAQPSPFLF